MKKVLFLLLLFPFSVKAFNTSARSVILMDMDSKRILYGKDMNYVQSVASISKIMTAICVIENTDINQEIIVGDEVLKSYGSGIYVQVGEKLKVKDLLYGLMMRSGNDAALVLAKNTSGSIQKFVSLMNKKSLKIGMKNTIFNNPSGLDEKEFKGNFSSAYDMALLMSYAMKNKEFRKIVSTKEYVLKTNKNVYKWRNKNKLLYSYKYMIGGKTGFTKKAKRTLVTSASKNNLNLVAVTINDGNDFKDHVSLFEEAFSKYNNFILFNKGKLSIIGENYYNNTLYIKNKVTYPLTLDEEKLLKIKYELKKERKYKNNDKVGMIKVYLGDQIIKKESIYVKV
ncbi:MAG: D-alanyl-D-alanine carboxypeptidase [Bacilli bacterium]|nr:D-alanyl-D-alanine carboxypeptidase [Bacilli bacterium]